MCRTKVNMREGFSETQKKIALAKSNRRCAHCGKPLDKYTMTVDHCIPLSKGGLNHDTNLVALCEECNKEKSNSVYKPSDYYKYIDHYQLEGLDKAFQNYIDQNSWFDIQTFFPMDHYAIPNYRPLMRYCHNFKAKGLKVFFNEYASKASKLGNYHFKRARFKHIHDIVAYCDEIDPDHFIHEDELKCTFDFIEHYLKNGAIFTLHQGDSKEIKAVFIFSLECILVNDDVSFGVKVATISDMSEKNYLWIYAYIESLVLKGIAKENNFTHIIMINEAQYQIPYYALGLFSVNGYRNKEGNIFYRCLSFDKKYRLIDGLVNERELPEQVKVGTPYYDKFFEVSDLTQKELEESLENHQKLYDEVKHLDDVPDVYTLGILNKRARKEN